MKILIIQQKMIGDVLTSSILFEALRQKYPKAQLDYLINSHTYPVVENNPFINNFIFFTKAEASSKKALFKLAKSVKKSNYDIVIDVYSKFSSNIITLFSGAKVKISKHKWYSAAIYTKTFNEANVAKTNAGLAIENRLQLITPILKESLKIIQPKIYLTASEIEHSKQFLLKHHIDLNTPLFMISVIGSGDNKTYPLPYMAKLIDAIVKNTNAQILFNYIPSQKEQARAVFNLCKNTTQNNIFFNAFGKSLRDFLAITKHCNALIGNEGGAVNMAKAIDIPTFTIFSPWIKKEAWSMFEDDKKHVSVHLKDFKTALFEGKSSKDLKSHWQSLYQEFLPSYFLEKLYTFIDY